jgi:hypothetical protein
MSIYAKLGFVSAVMAMAACTAMFVSSMRAAKADESFRGDLDVATEDCSETFVDTSQPEFPITWRYARHAYPGMGPNRVAERPAYQQPERLRSRDVHTSAMSRP